MAVLIEVIDVCRKLDPASGEFIYTFCLSKLDFTFFTLQSSSVFLSILFFI